MGKMDDADRVHIESRAQWRDWLATNAELSDGVWVVLWRDASRPSPAYDDLVEESLCFGWIDATTRPLDDERRMQWYSPRRARSPWAATNKVRVERLTREGQMMPAGQRVIDEAKASGMWEVLDGPEAGIEPDPLRTALDADPSARRTWDAYPASVRKYQLTQIALAVTPAGKQSRIAKVVKTAAEGKRP